MEAVNSGNVGKKILTPPLPPLSRSANANNENQVPQGDNVDLKKLKRIAASREYSQRYRLKQLQHTAKLEAELRALQANIAITIPRIKYADSQNALLRTENSSMKLKLSATTANLVLKEAEYRELLKEKDVLKQISFYQIPGDKETSHGQLPQFLMNMHMEQPSFNQFMGAAAALAVSNMLKYNSANQCGPSHDDLRKKDGSNGNEEKDGDKLM